MTIKQKLGIIIYGIACFILTIILFHWSYQRTQERLEEERKIVENLREEVQAVRAENESLRDIMYRANVAVEHAAVVVQDAKEKADERENAIINNTPDDWLMCELPSSVQDMFADYCHED